MTAQPVLSDWIGRREQNSDVVSLRQAVGMAAMFDLSEEPVLGEPLPPGWHWMFFAEISRQSVLSKDGHAPRGGFLPPVELPRRMWGGNRLTFHGAIRVGEEVRRESQVLSITEKDGRSGQLALVTVKHSYYAAEGLALEEEHDIVYRSAAENGNKTPTGERPAMAAKWSNLVDPDPVFLFRYSALTFNGHRIHYDAPYVTDVEGYPGLIVHGPLTATLLLELVRRELPNESIKTTVIRARRPLFSGSRFRVEGLPTESGAHTWAVDPEGFVAMTADVTFA